MTETESMKSAKFWDKNARKYAASNIADETEYQNGLEITRTFLDPSHRVLEIGCGTGTTALTLAPKVAHLTGTDISPEMIKICNEKKTAAGIANVSFAVGSTVDTALPMGEFDVVLAFSILHLVDDPDATVAQVSKLLKPGGIFISKTPCLNENFLFSLLRGPVAIAAKFNLAPKVKFFNVEQFDRMVESAGFEPVHAYTTTTAPQRRYLAAKKH